MRVIPTDTMPALDARLAGGGRWALAREKADKLALLAFYRGIFCPVCRVWVGELDRLAHEFERRGVSVIALTCDKKDAAERAVKEWGIANLRVGYAVDPEDARKAGLYISEGRGVNPVSNEREPMLFTEPAILLVRPEGELYAAWIQSTPYARPHLADVLAAVEKFVGQNLPDPRGSA
jgi:peroxiredoxin